MYGTLARSSLEIGHFHVENANLEKVSEAIEKKWTSPIIPNYQSFYDYINKGGYQNLKKSKIGKIFGMIILLKLI